MVADAGLFVSLTMLSLLLALRSLWVSVPGILSSDDTLPLTLRLSDETAFGENNAPQGKTVPPLYTASVYDGGAAAA